MITFAAMLVRDQRVDAGAVTVLLALRALAHPAHARGAPEQTLPHAPQSELLCLVSVQTPPH